MLNKNGSSSFKTKGVQVAAFLIVILILVSLLPGLAEARKSYRKYHNRYRASTQATISPMISPSLSPLPEDVTSQGGLANGQWDFFPGSKNTGDGLVVNGTHFAIVQQDGSSDASNPQLNLAGTHIEKISGDITINFSLDIPEETTATLQLYSKPPVIADEFRIEPASLQLSVTSGRMTIKTWNGNSQNPASASTVTVPSSSNLDLSIARSGESVIISANGKEVATVRTPSLFLTKNIWFGFEGKGGSFMVKDLSVQKEAGATAELVDGSTIKITKHNDQGFQKLATKLRPNFKIGVAVALGPLTSDPEYNAIALDSSMFGSITAENDMKMINLQPEKGVYTFQKADAIVKLAKQNGINDIHGHTLVFAEANPPWFNKLPVKNAADKKEIERIMLDHITTVVKHFGKDVTSWDVINEPIADYDDFDEDNIFRQHKWYQAMGEDYIIKALKAAHEANPDAMLGINEYGLEQDGDRWEAFIRFMDELRVDLKANNIPTSQVMVGFQSHVFEEGDQIDPDVLRNHMQQLAVLGYKAQVSENDVYSDDGFDIQSDQYASTLNACLSEKNCIAWRGWILSDRYDTFIDDDGSIEYGEDGLYSAKMQPRPAVKAMQQVLNP